MEMHWWCCECDATNSSPDDDHLVCSREGCGHHLCSDCFNPQQIGKDGHLNDHVTTVTTHTNVYKSVVNDAKYEKRKAKQSRTHMFKNARQLIGHHMKHSRIGRKMLSFWSYIQRKTGRKKEKLRIEGKKLPTVVVPSNAHTMSATSHFINPKRPLLAAASNYENLPSTSHYYEPDGSTQYMEDSYQQTQEATQEYTGESYSYQQPQEITTEYTGESYTYQQPQETTTEYTGEAYQPQYSTQYSENYNNYTANGTHQYTDDYYYYY